MQIAIESQIVIVSRNLPVASAASAPEVVVGPSKVTELHALDRPTDKRPGAPMAWRKLSHLQAAFEQSRLGPMDSDAAHRRRWAGETYTRLWDTAQSPGRDSTQQMDGAGGTVNGMPVSIRQHEAFQKLFALENALSPNDKTIVRAVCGTGHSPAEAMKLARLNSDTRVSARLCEALDSLANLCEKKFRK